jgi:hypothetical protein
MNPIFCCKSRILAFVSITLLIAILILNAGQGDHPKASGILDVWKPDFDTNNVSLAITNKKDKPVSIYPFLDVHFETAKVFAANNSLDNSQPGVITPTLRIIQTPPRTWLTWSGHYVTEMADYPPMLVNGQTASNVEIAPGETKIVQLPLLKGILPYLSASLRLEFILSLNGTEISRFTMEKINGVWTKEG